jgi:hypothetical protein
MRGDDGDDRQHWRQESETMDSRTFDAVARFFGNGMTRRKAIRDLVIGASGITAGSSLQPGGEAAARRRRRRKPIPTSDQCVRKGEGCGALNDQGVSTPPLCCHGHECVYHPRSGTWTCEAIG